MEITQRPLILGFFEVAGKEQRLSPSFLTAHTLSFFLSFFFIFLSFFKQSVQHWNTKQAENQLNFQCQSLLQVIRQGAERTSHLHISERDSEC